MWQWDNSSQLDSALYVLAAALREGRSASISVSRVYATSKMVMGVDL